MNTIRTLVAAAVLLLPPLDAMAQTWPNLPTTPIAVLNITDPNIAVTLDDSGSMAWAYVPDSLLSSANTHRFLASRFNTLSYNPFTSYTLPYDPAHVNDSVPSQLGTSFTGAWLNGYDTSKGSMDLSSNYCPTHTYDPSSNNQTYVSFGSTGGSNSCSNGSNPVRQAAYFYAYYSDVGPNCGTDCYTLPTPGQSRSSFTFNTTLPTGCTSPGTPTTPSPLATSTTTNLVNESCYVKVLVPAQHQQNFANWYSFYRTRNLTVVSGANIAFINLNPKFRVTWQAINTCNTGFWNLTTCKGWDNVSHPNKLRPFSDTAQKTNYYQWLARLPAANSTPLRTALIRAGDFFTTAPTNVNSPMANDPGFTAAPVSACRPNYNVMLTDGLWNTDPGSITSFGNFDNTARTLPDGRSYAAIAPYKDSWSNTLADIAMYYWANDLQPTVDNHMVPYYPVKTGPGNSVTASDYWDAHNDPATWQHMVTFTIGLGLNSFLSGTTDTNNGGQYMPLWGTNTFNGDYPNMVAGGSLPSPLVGSYAWPQPGTNFASNGNDANVADLWHAAINSRGQFFNANSPRAVQRAFTAILSRVNSQQTSLGQIGASTNRVTSGTVSMDVKFVPGDGNWYSTLTAYNVFADGSRGPAVWSTDTTFTSSANRNVFTWSGTGGMAFAWNSFTQSQQNTYFAPALNGVATNQGDQNLFNWLLGDRSKEFSDGSGYRVRPQLLGDIVGSDLLIAGKNDLGYSFMPDLTVGGTTTSSATARAAYADFVKNKTPVAFIGANDGMLHAFDALAGTNQGKEKFAYVPYTVWANSNPLSNLANLASVDYIHQFYVDGPLAAYDAYIGGSWKTYVAGGLGGGGKGVFVLDVTGPTQTSGTAFGAGSVVVELSNIPTDADLKEIGYSFAAPVIGRTVHGDWVALIANGYGGASCRAVLFIYDFATKATSKVDTGATYGNCATAPNGLSGPTAIQFAAGAIGGVYAGDYQGNVWKFKVNATTGAWSIDDPANLGQPFFTTAGPSGSRQWVTAPITIKKHPAGGLLLLFGTGKFFESNDRADVSVQTFYGLRDAGARIGTGRSTLVAQTIDSGSILVNGASKFRTVSNNSVDWSVKNGWYLDLNSTLPNGTGSIASGERVVAPAVLNFDSVLFTTYIPNVNSCTGAGSGYLMDLSAFSGGVDANVRNLDTNGDGLINMDDQAAAGMQLTTGVLKAPSVILVTTPPKGNAPPTGGSPTTCGGLLQQACPDPVNPGDPPKGCIQPYINNNGTCSKPKCGKGQVWVSTVSDGVCANALKQPTWMELQ